MGDTRVAGGGGCRLPGRADLIRGHDDALRVPSLDWDTSLFAQAKQPVPGDILKRISEAYLWLHLISNNRYGMLNNAWLARMVSSGQQDVGPEAMRACMAGRFRQAPAMAEDASFLRTEILDYGGSKIECYVI